MVSCCAGAELQVLRSTDAGDEEILLRELYPDRDSLIKPKAFIGLRKGYAPSDELANALIEHCKANMAAYKRPRWVEFMSELPKTATGKIQRSALRYSPPGASHHL